MNTIQYRLYLGLAGRIATYKNYYKGNIRMFDYKRVFISIGEYKDQFRYTASCICYDTSALGLSMIPYIIIYSSWRFKSSIEAESNLEKQVRFASKKFKETRFFLVKPIDHYSDGKLTENVLANYEYNGTKWIMTSSNPENPICGSCGHETKNLFDNKCDYCGGFIY